LKPWPWFVLAYAVFLLNDVAFIRSSGWQDWLAVDYGSRLLVLALLLGPRESRALLLRREPLRVGLAAALVLAAACVAWDRLLDHGLLPITRAWWGDHALARFPALPPIAKPFDLLFGVALVAVSEELLSRRATLLVLRPWLRSDAALIVVSALLFTGMHWSYSPPDLFNVFLIGLVLMAVYLRTGALWPVILAHYAIDVISFW
jgi:membrane protease YdiL (CAAX protease family)